MFTHLSLRLTCVGVCGCVCVCYCGICVFIFSLLHSLLSVVIMNDMLDITNASSKTVQARRVDLYIYIYIYIFFLIYYPFIIDLLIYPYYY